MLNSIKIVDVSEKQLNETLLKIFILIGLRQQHYPNEVNTTFLKNYLRNNFGNKTIDEFYLAFELGIQNKLDIDDVNPYDQFSIPLIEKVMQSYKRWLFKQSEDNKVKPIEIEYNMTKEEKLIEITEWENRTELSMNFIPVYLYEYLIEFNKINHTKEQKWEYYNKAVKIKSDRLKQDISNRKELKHFMSMIDKGILGDEKQSIINLSKKLIVYDYLKKKV